MPNPFCRSSAEHEPHHHHHHHGRPRLMGFVARRLHRRIFFWFGASILATVLAVSLVIAAMSDGESSWHREFERVERFTERRFAEVWFHPDQREALARGTAEDLQIGVRLFDAQGAPLEEFGPQCPSRSTMAVPVRQDGVTVGRIELCSPRSKKGLGFLLPIAVAGLVLWAASGRIARRLTRPLGELVRVTQEIGAGRLNSRAALGCWTTDEVGVLAEAINDMAGRIERQVNDQRVLLAAVSHELRTPLGHLRILVELARQNGADRKVLDDLESEVVEIDALVGELLASSRLDFTALSPQRLDARDVARRALERAGLDGSLLEVDGNLSTLNADPTLVARALANLIDNAQKHGGGVAKLRLAMRDGRVVFAIEDRGQGFRPGEELKVFEPFYRREEGSGSKSTLGLGLALVRRIAEAHGGRAYAENRPEGGARVSFELSPEPRAA